MSPNGCAPPPHTHTNTHVLNTSCLVLMTDCGSGVSHRDVAIGAILALASELSVCVSSPVATVVRYSMYRDGCPADDRLTVDESSSDRGDEVHSLTHTLCLSVLGALGLSLCLSVLVCLSISLCWSVSPVRGSVTQSYICLHLSHPYLRLSVLSLCLSLSLCKVLSLSAY